MGRRRASLRSASIHLSNVSKCHVFIIPFIPGLLSGISVARPPYLLRLIISLGRWFFALRQAVVVGP